MIVVGPRVKTSMSSTEGPGTVTSPVITVGAPARVLSIRIPPWMPHVFASTLPAIVSGPADSSSTVPAPPTFAPIVSDLLAVM